ncbi:MAG: hypothetical protein ACKVPY_09675 [Paracoccaceae bacterium]
MTGRAAIAGALYFLVVFAAAFVIGAIRVTLVAPRTGALTAVALELPVLLAIAWAAARRLVLSRLPGATLAERAVMGAVAFLILIPAEALLAVLAFGQTPGQFLAAFATAPGALCLAGQLGFAALPAVQRKSPE